MSAWRRRSGEPDPDSAAAGSRAGERLQVDPVACDGVGICAQVAPGVVGLDRWGYPVVPRRDLDPGEVGAAERAVRACPRRALWMDEGRAEKRTSPAPSARPAVVPSRVRQEWFG